LTVFGEASAPPPGTDVHFFLDFRSKEPYI
jgi:hypothetical protein